ncbi:Enamine deaminase RidA, house cleaning of reactive enamine intermediates, YjgF/YER057c/UK114 family [Fodinibius roseus]|uniref:Enamine deaminase RidA, house cleaning of reactive enamine intermediates, YjgF/YER057c/UK114 family n=1 Tax=Fodinibius roseus TaxID=1194090 RepID=A0A1M4W7I3_9BACT|nr:RidA family protein [Fodinibius roseus]SHE77169.1 Enamine deaminase RidA, house cleaning of reactive enamine intermediates, YjgF/YER057c/UK114 family [Fodinibius roseus]
MKHTLYRSLATPALLFFLVVTLLACGSNDAGQPVSDNEPDNYDYDVEERLSELGIELDEEPTPPVANYVPSVRTGNLIFLSGHGPDKPDGSQVIGKVGEELSIEEGQQAARLTAISLLTSLKAEIGDLNKVKRVVKVFGMVNATSDFTEHPQVINGFSDLMVEVFGPKGKHARAAVGMGSLPGNIPVEIDMIVEVGE